MEESEQREAGGLIMAIIDDFLAIENPWALDEKEMKDFQFRSIREAFGNHYANNKLYRGFCDRKGFTPENLQSYEDLIRIPVLSTRIFKEGFKLLSVDESEVAQMHTSSGSSGSQSRVPRDRITLDRFTISMRKSIQYTAGTYGYLAMLGPSPDELGDLALANYAKVGCDIAEDHEFFLKDYDFDPEYIIEKCNATPHRPVRIGGGPMLILDLADWILETGDKITSLTPESMITSGGGFKDMMGVAMDRDEYDEKVSEAFGLPKSNIRDAYGMSELNAIMLECSEQVKHVPPWIHMSIRNPANLDEEVAPGEEGLPAFLDPLANSYPGFVIADDIVRAVVEHDEVCGCGLRGPGLFKVVRRAEGAEEKGCGRHVDELRHQDEIA
jgi:long-chain-fatty-acid---luciferin-component ligase